MSMQLTSASNQVAISAESVWHIGNLHLGMLLKDFVDQKRLTESEWGIDYLPKHVARL